MAHLTGSGSSPADFMAIDSRLDCCWNRLTRSECMIEPMRDLDLSKSILQFRKSSATTVEAESELVYGLSYT